jgi:glycosyltransferase involved in cell wall biosynthesis
MLTIGFDSSPLTSSHKGRGVGTYTRELLQALKTYGPDFGVDVTEDILSPAVDIIHYPYFDLFFHTLSIIKQKPTIVTIHDVIPLLFPDKFPRGVKGEINFQLQKLSLKTTRHIITDSKASKKDITRFLHVNSNHITVTSLGVNNSFTRSTLGVINKFKAKHSLTSPFISYVGDINYNKNLPRLIEAVMPIPEVTLAIATRASLDPQTQEAQVTMATSAIKKALAKTSKNQVRFLKINSQEELQTLYSASNCYIQPSLYEGFGLPILEAMKCETPVLCSKTSSLPEIAGQAAIYFNPYNVSDITTAIKKGLSLTSKKREQLISQGYKQTEKFTWKNTAIHTIKAYKSTVKTK